ncbi:NAD-glutamate dehydrogenase domain-containing protein [Streptomyces parvulus]|uniref:NAD-glutamate dehydrogenase domain-containing protein n=1 Tax=Streptomyces parvulus TaxID=146923 RepID=UPI0033CD13DA
MRTKLDEAKEELLHRAARATERPPPGLTDHDGLLAFLQHYHRDTDPQDLGYYGPDEVCQSALSHFRLAQARPPGTARVRLHTQPGEESHGTAGYSLVEVVTDDMPYLVDSVINELIRQGRTVRLVTHPLFTVRRNVTGHLVEILPASTAAIPYDAQIETWIRVEIDLEPDEAAMERSTTDLLRVLADVREVGEDRERMWAAALRIADGLVSEPSPACPDLDLTTTEETGELLRWLADGHFTFLGYREYRLRKDGTLMAVLGTGLGILRSDPRLPEGRHRVDTFSASPPADGLGSSLLGLFKADRRSTVYRPLYPDCVVIRQFDITGAAVGERRFLGLFSTAATAESVLRVPVARCKATKVLQLAGFAPDSHSGRHLVELLEMYPREELLRTPIEQLHLIVTSVLRLQGRRILRVFVREDSYGGYHSVLVYLPRDRYTNAVRQRIVEIVQEEVGGTASDLSFWQTDSMLLSRLHFVVRPLQSAEPVRQWDADVARIELRLTEAVRSWVDGFTEALGDKFGPARAAELMHRCRDGDAFSEAYRADHSPRSAASDIERLERLRETEGETFSLSLYQPVSGDWDERRFRIYGTGETAMLASVLPILDRLGVEVVEFRSYVLTGELDAWIYDFGLQPDPALCNSLNQDLLIDAFTAVWTGQAEDDRFNSLVLRARITWREAMWIRAYAKYWQQLGPRFAQEVTAAVLNRHPRATRLLVSLFEARMSPERQRAGTELSDALLEEFHGLLEHMDSAQDYRVLRGFLSLIQATLRTNYFRYEAWKDSPGYLSVKFDPGVIPDLPAPHPLSEIWVYAPRVEGIYLRFGAIVRGGSLWLERHEDFRAEVVRLATEQMADNAAVVPFGAKGGFVGKRPPGNVQDRAAWRAEGLACYVIFVSALLDIADNVVHEEVIPPSDVVRHDSDDIHLMPTPELQGTLPYEAAHAAYQEVALARGYWLHDALGDEGPSAADIAARGVREAVRSRLRELGRYTNAAPLTVIAFGSLSNDVLNCILLQNPHIRLLAAFDGKHFFFDPEPDVSAAHAERRRLASLPGATWGEYDPSVISKGGGIHSRQAGQPIPVSRAVRRALSPSRELPRRTPDELATMLLQAPADLLLLGEPGIRIGTRDEQPNAGAEHAETYWANVSELRALVVAEVVDGCMTSAAREALALRDGRVGLPAADMLAGSMAQDMRTNLVIAMTNQDVHNQEGRLSATATEAVQDVARKALGRTAYLHHLVTLDAKQSHMGLSEHLKTPVAESRGPASLPTREKAEQRRAEGRGLTSPELAHLLLKTHAHLRDAALKARLPAVDWRADLLEQYFKVLPTGYRHHAVRAHPLRDAVAASEMAWQLIEELGPARPYSLIRVAEGGLDALAAAFTVCRDVLKATRDAYRRRISGLPPAAEIAVGLARRRAVSAALLWLLLPRPSFGTRSYAELRGQNVLTQWAPHVPSLHKALATDLREVGVPHDLACEVQVVGCLGFAHDAQLLAAPAADPVAQYVRSLRKHRVADALTAGLAALRRDDNVVRQLDALGFVRHGVFFLAALEGTTRDGERPTWQSLAAELVLRSSGAATAALAPEIIASVRAIRSELANRLNMPTMSRAPSVDRPPESRRSPDERISDDEATL